jgi:hypothetical protein
MPSKKLANLSVGTILFLASYGVVAATTTAAFFGTGFLLLTHAGEEMRGSSPRLRATAATENRRAPTDTTAATENRRAPTGATAAPANQPAPTPVPPATRPNYPASPTTTVVMQADPDLIAAFTQAAAKKGITLKQYREARLRFLRQQQAQLDLQLSDPNLSATEKRRLERQRAYWGRAIEQTMALP